MKPKRCDKLWPFTGPIPDGQRRRCTLEVGHSGLHTIIPPSGMDYAPDDEPESELPEPEETAQELRDQKMALLLVVDDCHRIMGEQADKIDAQDNILRAINETLAGLHMPVGDRTVMLANVRKLAERHDEMVDQIHRLKVIITENEGEYHNLYVLRMAIERLQEIMEGE